MITPNTNENVATTSKGSKRNHGGTHNEIKAKKTKGIRKIQNSSGFGVVASSVTIGHHDETQNEDDDDADEAVSEEEEEAPHNISLGQRTLAVIAHSIQKFQDKAFEYASVASKASEQTNSLLKAVVKKLDSRESIKGTSVSSNSSFSSSSPAHSSSLQNVELWNRNVFTQPLCLDNVEAPRLDIAQCGEPRLDIAQTNPPRLDIAQVEAPRPRLDIAQVEAPGLNNDQDDAPISMRNRPDSRFNEFKVQLDTLLRQKIPRQYQHLNFKEMRGVVEVNLSGLLNDIDSTY